MPWKRKRAGLRLSRPVFIALAAAVFGRALAAKYSAYRSIRSLIGNRSPAEIKAAMERRGIKVP